jgi:hypothetical protein
LANQKLASNSKIAAHVVDRAGCVQFVIVDISSCTTSTRPAETVRPVKRGRVIFVDSNVMKTTSSDQISRYHTQHSTNILSNWYED